MGDGPDVVQVDASVEGLRADEDEVQHLSADLLIGVTRFAGPVVRLKPKAAETLGLAVRDLATDAVRHGALSVKGRVDVTGRVARADDAAGVPLPTLPQREIGGPAVRVLDGRRGFGTELLEQALASDRRAEAALDFGPGGCAARSGCR